MHHTLVFFTVLSQASVGVILFSETIATLEKPGSGSAGFRKSCLQAALSMLLVSLAISFFHLGSPQNAVHALKNIGSSWLSREILFLVLFLITLAGNLFAGIKWQWGKRGNLLAFLPVTAAIFFLYSMIRLYMIPSVLSWNSAFTPAAFMLTALTGGSVFAVLFSGASNRKPGKILIALAVSFLIISVINSSISSLAFGKFFPFLLLARIILSSLAVILLIVIYSGSSANKTAICKVIMFMIALASEIIGRYIFFLYFDKNGL